MKIGILGGTFNPIHMGHLMIAEHIRQEKNFDKILFIPTGDPPHKDVEVPGIKRAEMVRLAISDNRHFEMSPIEVNREGRTFTVDTLNELKNIYDEMHYIVGSDTIFQFRSWKNFKEVAEMTKFIYMLRPGTEDTVVLRDEIEFLRENFSVHIEQIEGPMLYLSSTYLRERIKTGKSIKYLVPDNVIKYINDEGLYV